VENWERNINGNQDQESKVVRLFPGKNGSSPTKWKKIEKEIPKKEGQENLNRFDRNRKRKA